MSVSHGTRSVFMYSCCHRRLETGRIGSFWQSITALMNTQECVTSNRHADGKRLKALWMAEDAEREHQIGQSHDSFLV